MKIGKERIPSDDVIDLKEASKRTILLIQIAMIFSWVIMVFNFIEGMYVSAVLLIMLFVSLTVILVLTKKGYLKYSKPAIVLLVNLFLLLTTKAEGLNSGSYIFFIPFLYAIPFAIEDTNTFKKELF